MNKLARSILAKLKSTEESSVLSDFSRIVHSLEEEVEKVRILPTRYFMVFRQYNLIKKLMTYASIHKLDLIASKHVKTTETKINAIESETVARECSRQLTSFVDRLNYVFVNLVTNEKNFLRFFRDSHQRIMKPLMHSVSRFLDVQESLIHTEMEFSNQDLRISESQRGGWIRRVKVLRTILKTENVEYVATKLHSLITESRQSMEDEDERIAMICLRVDAILVEIEEYLNKYAEVLLDVSREELENIRHSLLQSRADAIDSKFVVDRIMADKVRFHRLKKEINCLDRRFVVLEVIKRRTVDLIRGVRLLISPRSFEPIISKMGEIESMPTRYSVSNYRHAMKKLRKLKLSLKITQ